MTNTNWRDNYLNMRVRHQSSSLGNIRLIDEEIKFIQSTLDSVLKDQKEELLDEIPKEKKELHPKEEFEVEEENTISKKSIRNLKRTMENNADLEYRQGFNDCLEIIKGLIKGG